MCRRSLVAAVSLVAAAQLVACGGGGSSSSAPTSASKTVGAAGGTVALTGGASVSIPAGALSADTTVTVAQAAGASPTGTVGAVYDLGPSGTTFAQPVTVTLPVPAGTTAAAVWTKTAGAAHYTSLPTTVGGGVATAQASHFSVFLVGPVDLTGTWAGMMSYAVTNPNGTSAGVSTQMQSRDVVQDVGAVTITVGNSTGFTATCTGTVQGASLNTACTGHSLDGTCTTSYTQTGTVSGDTWFNDSTLTWPANCGGGLTYTAQNSPLARQPGPARNITGTYARTNSYTMTGPGKAPYQGSGSGTAVRTQAAGSSLLGMTYTSGTSSYTCKGVVVGDTSYGTCNGTNGAIRYVSTGDATITSGPPFVLDGENLTSIYNDPNGYTSLVGTYHDVQQ